MSRGIMLSSQPKKPFHHRNGSDELDVFEAASYFSGVTECSSGTHRNICVESHKFSCNNTQKYDTRPIRRMSLDMSSHRGNSINPLQSILIENPNMISKEKKFKQPSSPGGKLAHFLNSLFNPTSLKKSKPKKKSTKDEDESPSGWRRKRRSSMSHFRSGNTTSTTIRTAIIMTDDKSSFSNSTNSGFRTPPPYHVAHTPSKATSCRDPRSYSHLKPLPSQITKIPVTEKLNKIENFTTKSYFPEKTISFRNGSVEKVKIFNENQEEHHPRKCVSRENINVFKKFSDDDNDDGDDGADSDSSSDLFELTNCDLSYHSSGLPVYETTHIHMDRCALISN